MPASALLRAARQRGHRAEGHEVAGRMINRLTWQGLWLRASRRFGLGVIDAVCVLHQRVEAAPVRPRAFVTVGAERHVDDARAQLRELLRSEAVLLHGTGPVALHEDVGVARE